MHLQIAYTRSNAITFDMEDGPATIGVSQHRSGGLAVKVTKLREGGAW